LWATRNGVRPLAIPHCGFNGTECPPSFTDAYLVYVIIAACVVTFITMFLVFAVIYYI
jgi:hypothetical protein